MRLGNSDRRSSLAVLAAGKSSGTCSDDTRRNREAKGEGYLRPPAKCVLDDLAHDDDDDDDARRKGFVLFIWSSSIMVACGKQPDRERERQNLPRLPEARTCECGINCSPHIPTGLRAHVWHPLTDASTSRDATAADIPHSGSPGSVAVASTTYIMSPRWLWTRPGRTVYIGVWPQTPA
ncbi:Pb-fam-2 protein [Anopheles sinensis]|uniref:Pb-fam-2 protein n=1 Tax=Anopheles sinensis TaxID=74873 RepID=A0A084VYJ2_ANOSI|nr:Pb-fam-2 protein [Anopheles sinensis]